MKDGSGENNPGGAGPGVTSLDKKNFFLVELVLIKLLLVKLFLVNLVLVELVFVELVLVELDKMKLVNSGLDKNW